MTQGSPSLVSSIPCHNYYSIVFYVTAYYGSFYSAFVSCTFVACFDEIFSIQYSVFSILLPQNF